MEFVRWRTVVPSEGKGSNVEEAIGSSRSDKTINILLCITCLPNTAEEAGEEDRKRAATSLQRKDQWSGQRSSTRAKIALLM
ncbi:hypothetical protein R3I93_020241 [Phoxinus phoxinus]|uniref:Uncharacterized protein n=1 Tax=Phoxinus phoxinus TaxID=58324 RepID=A0AAN9CA21_9TELE